jgi:hypothetical protein
MPQTSRVASQNRTTGLHGESAHSTAARLVAVSRVGPKQRTNTPRGLARVDIQGLAFVCCPPFPVLLTVTPIFSSCRLSYHHHGECLATAVKYDIYFGVVSSGLFLQSGVLSVFPQPTCKVSWPKVSCTHVLVRVLLWYGLFLAHSYLNLKLTHDAGPDVLLPGQYVFEIKRMHAKFGK